MKVVLKASPEQIALLRKTGSRNRSIAMPAMEAFASVLSPVVQVVLDKLSTVRSIYSVKPIAETDNAEFPLDVFFDEKDNDIRVHFQSRPGGTPTSHMSNLETVIVPTANYQAEVSWQNSFARAGRLDVVASYLHKLSQAMIRKEEINGWAVLLDAVAKANTNGLSHVVTSATADGVFHLDLLNQLLVRSKRINTSIDGGTAANAPQGITDIYMSIEAMGDVRSFTYNPINTRGAVVSAPAAGDSSIALPDEVRRAMLSGAGLQTLFGLTLHEMNEFGSSFAYNRLFKSSFAGTFVEASDEIIIGVDGTRDSAVMPVKGSLNVENDIFMNRSDKSGVLASQETGFAVLDNRQFVAGIIDG